MNYRFAWILALMASAAGAQTTTTTKPVAHRSSTAARSAAAKKATAAAATTSTQNPADNPPNIPKVEGTPKPLYALRYIDIEIGTGPVAEAQKFYTVHYTGWFTDGTKFDSSHDHPGGEPIVFPYGGHRVIAGWDTGFQGMHVGGKRRLYIPYQLAYGETGRPPVIPAKADLIFDVELVAQSDTPPEPAAAPAAPPKPAAPPTPPSPAGTTSPSGTTPQ